MQLRKCTDMLVVKLLFHNGALPMSRLHDICCCPCLVVWCLIVVVQSQLPENKLQVPKSSIYFIELCYQVDFTNLQIFTILETTES